LEAIVNSAALTHSSDDVDNGLCWGEYIKVSLGI